jgi:prephenate dehydratase
MRPHRVRRVFAVNPTSASPTIAYQGEPGANSHIACERARPDHVPMAGATFEDVFAAVSDSTADLAMIPIENLTAGCVADIHYLLPASELHIVGEHFLLIHFGLAVNTRRADRGPAFGAQPHPGPGSMPQNDPPTWPETDRFQ